MGPIVQAAIPTGYQLAYDDEWKNVENWIG